MSRTSRELLRFPHVVADASVVEASPGVFASVMIDDESFRSRPSMSRAAKFGWLLERCSEEGRLTALRERLEWPDDDFWDAFATCSDPEQQAALVCSLTAACVVQKRYVAVGELNGGYFFLPPWDLWADWGQGGESPRTVAGPRSAVAWRSGSTPIRETSAPCCRAEMVCADAL